ncbi:PREDICTED: TMV resistance [Prunus dulcis]|uniref:ADP-ribosyl cyclase/cyclic ADP-ribose hydrolase n=1 Tax=Prunus dulcis TaxID=3755 RepID=A0A5E4G8D3_PRUDU|nr:PREDICTED: TMV resistance [Prunus dulcis]
MALSTKRASSTSVPRAIQWKYDVFLSFSGEDTRKRFTAHLYEELKYLGIRTFLDNPELEIGKPMPAELSSAITESRLAIIVISPNYASSTWCLDELLQILQCMEARDTVLPIFYDLEPSDVRKQTGSLAKAFSDHEKRFDTNKLKDWKAALTKVANLTGWTAKDNDEPELIKEIVACILSRVRPDSQEKLVGIDSRLEQLDLLLDARSEDVLYIGIWGMNGIGKTTIAKMLYERILHKYEVASFLGGVREDSETNGLVSLQKSLSKSLLNRDTEDGGIHEEALKNKLSQKKVLLILDDVDHISQLDKLCGNQDWFGPGSRIIITTVNEQLLIAHGVERRFKVQELNEDDALQLFSWRAFKRDYPDKKFTDLSISFLNYAKGLPLALKVLGSFLYKRGQDAWSSALYKLKEVYKGDVMDTLKISYDGLDEQEKNVFVDIACFFKGKCKDQVVEMLDNMGFCSRSVMDVLIEKSLLTISDNKVWMHDLLQDMGWEIVRQQATEPGKRSRLWTNDSVRTYIWIYKGTTAVHGISLDLRESKEAQWDFRAFSHLVNLSFLKIRDPQGLNCFSNSLGFLEWSEHPLKSLPTGFQPENISELSMHDCSIQLLCNGKQNFFGLKVIDLRHSLNLTEIPDLTSVPNLERLCFKGCKRLVEIHPSTGVLKRLISLNLENCRSLKSLPSQIAMEYLESLILSGCSNVKKIPEFGGHMKHLLDISLDGTATENIPLSVERLTKLSSLDLRNCINLRCLPSNIGKLTSLQSLRLSGCSNLDALPESFGELRCLEMIDLAGTAIKEWPSSIVLLNLKSLFFRGPKGPSRQPWHMALPFRLRPTKSRQHMNSFLPSLSGLRSLTELDLSDSNLVEGAIPADISCLSSLVSLNLSGNNFHSLPITISLLSKLENLYLSDCKSLQWLPVLSSYITLEVMADGCTSLKTLQYPSNLDRLKSSCFNFINCIGLVDKGGCKKIAFSMLKRYLKRVPYPGDRYEIVIPGTEIPSWFSHQRVGSSVSVQLTPRWHDNKWKGYALCTVFEVFGSGWELNCFLKVNGKEQYPAPLLVTNVQPLSDHLWLLYISRDLTFGNEWQHSCNQLIFSFKSSGPSLVKKCGARLVYEQDVEEFNRMLTHSSRTISPYEATNVHHDENSTSVQGAIVQPSYNHCEWKGLYGSSSFHEESEFKRFRRI